jgi:hypothetical protein
MVKLVPGLFAAKAAPAWEIIKPPTRQVAAASSQIIGECLPPFLPPVTKNLSLRAVVL